VAVAATPDLGASIQTVTTHELGPAIAIPNLANTGTVVMPESQRSVTTSAVEMSAQNITPQAVTVTASSSGNSLAMEHFEGARRKGVSLPIFPKLRYRLLRTPEHICPRLRLLTSSRYQWPLQAALSLNRFQPYPTTSSVDIPNIESEAWVNFAEEMSSQRQTIITNT
jgi:hypothetical protein